jgi:hypothetical protein
VDLVASPTQDLPFWREALSRITRPDAAPPRILISGASDFGICEVVRAALPGELSAAALTVVDRCNTPLLINRWYAEQVGVGIETIQADILEFTPPAPYDVICAHAFIDQLPSAQWRQLVGCWRDLLRPGGMVITLNRLQPGSRGESRSAAPDIRARVIEANRRLPADNPLPLAETCAVLERYWRGRRGAQFDSPATIIALLSQAGFGIEHTKQYHVDVRGRASLRHAAIARRI